MRISKDSILFIFVVGCSTLLLPPLTAQSAQVSSCSSQAQCLEQAQASLISHSEIGWTSSGVWLYDILGVPTQLSSSRATGIAYNPWVPNLSLLTSSGSISWSDQPYTIGQETTGRLLPTSGFTIMMVYQNEWDPTSTQNGIALSMMNLGSTAYTYDNGVLFSIGRKGNQWTFGHHIYGQNGSQNNSTYWETPWDPQSTVPGAWEWIYYTFTPDGKVRIDKFRPYTYYGATAYDWQESVLDGGYPFAGFPAGTPTSNPAPLPFYTSSGFTTGDGLDDLGHQSYMEPTVPVPGFNRLDVFKIPFSIDQMVAYQKSLVGSYFYLTWGSMLPCNTGLWMNVGQVSTPCGYAGNGNPPAASVSAGGITVTPNPAQITLAPQNLTGVAVSSTSVTLTWNASLDPSDLSQVNPAVTQYIINGGSAPVTVTATSACSGTTCTATINKLGAGQQSVFSVTAIGQSGSSLPSSQFRITPTVLSAGPGMSYTTLVSALAALPITGGTIQIAPGTYHEKLVISQPNVILIGTGTDASKVVITYDDSVANGNDAQGNPIPRINPATKAAFSTSGTYTVLVTGDDFYATNLTIQNTADFEAPNYENNGQAVALMTEGDRSVFRAVMILGGQDTLYSNGAGKRSYFHNSYIEGYVDYIFGNGKTVIDSSVLKTKIHSTLVGEATITAQNRATATEDDGYVITNSQLLFDDPYMTNVWLGRPWGAYSTVYYIDTKMGSQVVPAGWIEFIPLPVAQDGTNNLPTSTYREYGTLYPGSSTGSSSGWVSFNLAQRESISPSSNVSLTAAQASALSPSVYLQGGDNWDPTSIVFGSHTAQVLPYPSIPAGVPGKPTIVSTVGGDGNIQLTWTASPANPVEAAYSITAVQNGVTYGPMTFPPNASSGYISGLTNGIAATVSLVEVNASGTSAAATTSGTPVAQAPSVPLVTSTSATSTSGTVNFTVQNQGSQPVWNEVDSHGIYYALYSSVANFYSNNPVPGTAGGEGATSPITSYTFTGLAPNTTYYVSLRAYNGSFSPTVMAQFTTAGQ